MLVMTGVGLAYMNGRLMEGVRDLTPATERGAPPAKPLDRRIPWRAAAIVGLGAAVLYLVIGSPWTVWAAGAPLGGGGAAWLLTRFQARPPVALGVLGGVGMVLSLIAVGGDAFVPAALALGAAHFPAGMMVAYYSRGEGPR
jgi:hypothetical protein